MCRLLIASLLLLLMSCGPKSLSTKINFKSSSIINGRNVNSNDTIASSIVGVYNFRDKSLCTGSLITSNIVLTAAHCAPARASDIKIVFTNDIDDTINSHEQDILQELILPAIDFKVSPLWNPKDESREVDIGDIALIKFRGKIPEGHRPAVFLPDMSVLRNGTIVTVAGFGVNIVTTKQVDPKKYPNLDEAIEYGEVACDETNGSKKNCFEIDMDGSGILRTTVAPIFSIDRTEISLDERRAGTCNGDSGGPAFIEQNGVFYLFGVTSRGSALCNEVGVYTNALYYGQWIIEAIKSFKQ